MKWLLIVFNISLANPNSYPVVTVVFFNSVEECERSTAKYTENDISSDKDFGYVKKNDRLTLWSCHPLIP